MNFRPLQLQSLKTRVTFFTLASAFRRQVIAEGVETVAHGTMLLQLGCDFAQGYAIARPMPVLHQCRFGTWRASEGRARHGAQPTLTIIDSLHRQAHTLAEAILTLQAQGKNPQALVQPDRRSA